MANKPDIGLIGGLDEVASEQQIKKDVKKLNNIFVPLKAKLDFSEVWKQLNKTKFTIPIYFKGKDFQIETKRNLQNAQKIADRNKVKVSYSFEMDKNKFQNQLINFSKENSKLFTSKEMTQKYNQLVDSAYIAKSSSELKGLRKQLSAFRTELIAVNKAGMTWTDKFKASISHFAQYFSGSSFIYTVANQLRNAWTEAKTLDDRLVDLQKVTSEIENRDSLYKYFDKALKKANELNVEVGSLIYAITEFKKLGWSLSDAELGGEWATKLSNVGDIDIDTAIGSIKTSIASFEEIGGYGNDQMDKKLEAYADLINNMSNKYSIDAEGLAEAIRLSAGTLTEANTTIEQAATMFATANKYYNDPKYLGNTAKVGSLRLRATTGDKDAIKELSEMGEEVEEVTALTGKLRKELLRLTGVDIMVDNNTFKSYYDQLYEISQVIDKLDDTTSAKVLELLFGKNRAAAGASLLSGMQGSEKAYADAINSVGSATAEYEIWMQSAEAATQRFSNSLTEMYQSIINGNTVRDLANIGSSVIDFANKWGILEGAVKGYLALKIGTAITSGTMAFVSATKQVEQYGKALQMVKNIPNGNLAEKYTALRDIAQATSSLTDKQLKQVLASEKLSYQDRIRILQIQGMNKEIALQKLAEMKLTQVTNAQTVSTFNLKSAMIGLKSTIQGVFLSNPVGITLMGLSVGFSALTSAISNYNQKLEETKQKNIEASEKAVEQANSLKELYSQYFRLSFIQERTVSQEEELKNVVEDITKKLGDKAKALEGLTAGTNEYAEALSNLTKEELQSASVEATIGRKIAEEDLQKDIWSDLKGSKVTIDSNSKGKALSDEAQKAVDIVSDSLKEFETINRSWNNLAWDITSDSPEEALEYYNALVQAREKLVLASEDDEALLETEVYKDLNSAINTMSDSLEDYISKRYEEEKLNYMARNRIPQTVEEYHAMKSAMDKVAGTSEGLKRKFNDLLTADFSGLATSIGSVAESGEHLADSISSFNIESFSNTIQSYEDGYKRLTEAQEEWNEAKSVSAETFADLQESGLLEYLDFTSEGLTINKEKLLENAQASKDKAVADLHAAMMSDMLQIALGNVDSVSEEAKSVIAQLGDNTETAGNQALNSVGNWATLGAVITDTMARARGEDRGFNGVNEEQKAQMSDIYDYYKNMAEKVSAIDITVPDRTKKAKDSAKKETDTYLKEFEKALEKLKTLKEQGKISESEFLAEYKVLYEKYFKDIDKYADEFAEHQHERLKGLKDLYDSAISAVVKFKDEKLNALKDEKDTAISALEKERDARLEVIETQKEQLESQNELIESQIKAKEKVIDGIEDQIESIEGVIAEYEDQIEIYDKEIDYHNQKIDAINDEIKAMSDANDERKRSLNLQKAQYDLERMQNQKTDLALVNNQMVYRPNEQGIRDARENVSDAKLDIAIADKEKEISAIEKEIDAIERQKSHVEDLISQREKEIEQKEKSISLIEKEIELLNNQKDSVNEQMDALEKQNDNIEKYYENLIKQQEEFYDSMIKNAEAQKSKWEELAEIKEVADAHSAIEQVFGKLGYTVDDVLNDSAGAFEDFKNQYINLLDVMNSNDSFGNGLSYAVEELDKTLANVGTNTEGLDNLPVKMEEINSSVAAVSDAFSGGENSLQNSVQNVIDKVAGSSEDSKSNDSKEKESEADTGSLVGAIQAQYNKTYEVIPQQIEKFNLFESAIGGCVNRLNEMIVALERVQTLSSSINVGGVGLQPVNGYATGTTYAKKGLAVLAEDEKPELLKDNKGNLSLVTEPTLVNMEGGEKVYNGEETKNLLKGNKIHDAWVEYTTKYANNPALLSASIMENSPQLFTASQDIWNRHMDYLTGKDKIAPRVENRTQTQNLTQNINVTLPNVTNETGFKYLEREINGYQNYARQQSSITR